MTDIKRMRTEKAAPRHERLRAWAAKRQRDERGATLVEAAFVTPVFVVILLGIFEFTGYIMARSSMEAALQAGARAAVAQANSPFADQLILERMNKEGAGFGSSDTIKKIVIWHAETSWERPGNTTVDLFEECFEAGHGLPGATPPRECNEYNDPANNVFLKADLPVGDPEVDVGASADPGFADHWFGCDPTEPVDVNTKYDCGWPPSTRQIFAPAPDPSTRAACADYTAAQTNDGCKSPDRIGIYIEVEHRYYTGLFPGRTSTIKGSTVRSIEPGKYKR